MNKIELQFHCQTLLGCKYDGIVRAQKALCQQHDCSLLLAASAWSGMRQQSVVKLGGSQLGLS